MRCGRLALALALTLTPLLAHDAAGFDKEGGEPMVPQQFPVQPEQVSDEARVYLAALESQKGHPLVASHFYQVTHFTWHLATQGKVEFYALEFRVGPRAAMVWNDGEGHWGAGDWLTLPDGPDADVVTRLTLQYFENRKGYRTFLGALKRLTATITGGP